MGNWRKLPKIFWDEFIYGGHLLSLGSSAIVLTVLILMERKIEFQLLLIPYLIAQIIYGYNHYKEIEEDFTTNTKRAVHLKKKDHSASLLLYIISLTVVLFLYSNLLTSIFVFLFTLSGILYTEFFKNITKIIPGFKSFYVAFFWAIISALPYFYYSLKIDLFLLLIILFIFIRFVLSTAIFDVKDRDSDKKNELKTFPVIFGGRTIVFFNILNFASLLPLIIGIYLGVFPIFIIVFLSTIIINMYFIKASFRKGWDRLHFLSYCLVDGEYIFWPLLVFLGKNYL